MKKLDKIRRCICPRWSTSARCPTPSSNVETAFLFSPICSSRSAALATWAVQNLSDAHCGYRTVVQCLLLDATRITIQKPFTWHVLSIPIVSQQYGTVLWILWTCSQSMVNRNCTLHGRPSAVAVQFEVQESAQSLNIGTCWQPTLAPPYLRAKYIHVQ